VSFLPHPSFLVIMYILHTYPDRFLIERDVSTLYDGRVGGVSNGGVVGQGAGQVLVIERSSGNISKLPAAQAKSPRNINQQAALSERIEGVLGIIQLLRCRYLIVMTSSKHVATLQGYPVRHLVDSKIIPFETAAEHPLTKEQEADEKRYLHMVQRVLRCGYFYFSYDYDLTLNTQRIAAIRADAKLSSESIVSRADKRFMWNHFLSTELLEAHADEFIIPVMNGYVFQAHQRIKGHDVTFVLISRRSHERTGKRFVTRGLDEEGHAANFVETEQIVFVTDPLDMNSTRVASFVETRGSIPVLWEQPVTLKYTPRIHFQLHGNAVDPTDDAARKKFEVATDSACRKHFEVQTAIYGKQVCLNLINQKGAELALVKAFKHSVDTMNRMDVRLVNWDFHQECRKMKYENISKLCDLVKDDVEAMGYFTARVSSNPTNVINNANGSNTNSTASVVPSLEWEILSRQSGVLRTNCVDCLDRTNVVQSVFARRALDKQLRELCGFVSPSQGGQDVHTGLETMFRHVWANNADAMSFQYSGTGALKTDYTRTGKRTLRGACMDGVNSVTRYYLNNFKDGSYQDSLDLFLGVYRPTTHQPSPFHLSKQRNHPAHQKSLWSFVWAFTLAMTLIVATWTHVAPPMLAPHKHWSLSTQLLAFGAAGTILGSKLLVRYGRDYANKPILRTLTWES